MATITLPQAHDRRMAERRTISVPMPKFKEHAHMQTGEYQAFQLLRFVFVVAPLFAGIDKFFNFLVNWEQYISPLPSNLTGLDANQIMMGVGVIEIIAAFIVAFKPKIGSFIVGCWLLAIIANLLLIPDYYDIALRDFGLAIGAFALFFLARDMESHRDLGNRYGVTTEPIDE